MITLDTNPSEGLALVDHGEGAKPRYEIIALADAPPLPEKPPIAPVYIRQAHYVASHEVVGLFIADLAVPKGGWKYKR